MIKILRRTTPLVAAFFLAVSAGVLLAAVPLTGPLQENFSAYPRGGCIEDGSAFGPWVSISAGGGCNQVETDGVIVSLDQRPQPSFSRSETHASLTIGPSFSAPAAISLDLYTNAQLRRNDPPNPWEVASVLWDYTDDAHYYYFQPKPNGWELGKEDPTFPDSKRALATGTSPIFPIQVWHTIKVIQDQNVITVYANGELIASYTDRLTPYMAGSIGLTGVDSDVRFANISVAAATGTVTAPPSISTTPVSIQDPASATINWMTNEPGDSQVQYGPTPSYNSITPLYTNLTTTHSVVLTGLSPGTLYHYVTMSRDSLGTLTISTDSAFTTIYSTPSALSAATASIDAQAKAPQKFLSPALSDGINDVATFGPAAAEVSIYNVRGRQVFHASQQGGVPIVWTCRDGSGRIDESGVYIAKIRTNGSGTVYQSFALVK